MQIQLALAQPEEFQLDLRIPSWSAATRVSINNQVVAIPIAGLYLSLRRGWKNADTIDLELDMAPHYWAGERECFGYSSVYRGPILLAFDPVYNAMDPDAVPELDAHDMRFQLEETKRWLQPWALYKVKATNGSEVVLCDFASAGMYGNYYRSWLPIQHLDPVAFQTSRPVWNNRPK